MNKPVDPPPQVGATISDEARTRRALLHMLEDLQRERDVVRQAKQHWLDTVDSLDAPLLVHDEEFRVVRANRAYATQAGMGFGEMIGRPYWECFPRLAAAPQAVPAQCELPTGESFAVRSFQIKEGSENRATWLHLFEDVTGRRRSEAEVRALQEISGSEFLRKGDVERVAREITETASRVTGVARANVWLFNEAEDELRCIDHYEAADGSHSAGMVLREHEFGNEFSALKNAPYVDANEPLTDPRTSGYVESYLKPFGITAMLDTVVEVSGKHIGLLCLEHVGKQHQWQPDEIAFAARLADKIAVVVTNRATLEAQAEIERRERYLHKLIEGSTDAFFVIDRAGKLLYRSESAMRLTGYAPGELMGKDIISIVLPESLPAAGSAIAELLAHPDETRTTELRAARKDGSVVELEVLGRNLIGDPDVKGIVVTARDITARKNAEREMRWRTAFFESLVQTSADGILVVDAKGRKVVQNQRMAELWKIPKEIADDPDDAPQLEHVTNQNADPKQFLDKVLHLYGHPDEASRDELNLKDGSIFERYSAPVLDRKGRSYGRIWSFHDVTARKAGERALRESEEKFRAIFHHTRDGILVMNIAAQSVRFANPSMELMLGYAPGELGGVHISRLHPADALAQVLQQFEEATSDGLQVVQDIRMCTKDGQTVYVDLTGSNVEIGGARYLLGAFRDATERRAGEKQLRKKNRALMTLSAGNEALVRATDEESLLKEMVRILCEIGGYPIVWVGYALDSADRSVEPKACVGIDPDMLRRTGVSWADNARGQTAIGRAIRLGQTQHIRNVMPEVRTPERKAAMQARNIRDVLGLPMRASAGERAFGAIGIATNASDGFDAEEIKLLEELASDLAYGIANLRAGVEQRAAGEKLRRSLEGTIGAVAATMESRDPYTAGHQQRVAALATAIAKEMGLAAGVVEGIHFGSLIHDLGKIQVPAEILTKPTRLTGIEFELIKTHPQTGYDIVKSVEFPWPVARMMLEHHERLDGTGYPQGLKGDAISLEARILAVADVVEAMSSHRPYRPGLGIDAALKEIEQKRGTWFEPAAVDACARLFREKLFVFDSR